MPNQWSMQQPVHMGIFNAILDDHNQFDHNGMYAQYDLNKVEVRNKQQIHIGKIYNLSPAKHPYSENLHRILRESTLIKSDVYVGVEVEVENITSRVILPNIWVYKEDGSLRNHGVEYISHPTPAKYITDAFKRLQKALHAKNHPQYTHRTSTHVHVNVLNLTPEQLRTFVLYYLCVEQLFFSFVGNNRKNSIFCVPLLHAGYTPLLYEFFNADDSNYTTFKYIIQNWHKYTALNLKCTRDIGTVEFRHLIGTNDPVRFEQWLGLITSIYEKAVSATFKDVVSKVQTLNTSSEYENFILDIFGDLRSVFPDNLQENMEDSVTHIKNCFFKNNVEENYNKETFKKSSFYKILKIKEFVVPEDYVGKSKLVLEKRLRDMAVSYERCSDNDERLKLAVEYNKLSKYILENF